jgi:hypothetical protein
MAVARESGPRIITPSITAWPPTAISGFFSFMIGSFAKLTSIFRQDVKNAIIRASRAADKWRSKLGAGYFSFLRLYLRLNFSTRPAVSMIFCLPV